MHFHELSDSVSFFQVGLCGRDLGTGGSISDSFSRRSCQSLDSSALCLFKITRVIQHTSSTSQAIQGSQVEDI
jgi:hypothetical protein